MASRASTSVRRSAVVAVVISTALALAGCVDAAPQPDPSTSGSSAPTPTSTAVPVPTPTAGAETIPIDVDCFDLVSADAIYAFNPNLGLLGSWTPDAGTPAAAALAADGVACRWVMESSGTTMDVSAARLGEAQLSALKDEAFATSTQVPTYGDDAYFSTAGGAGTAIVFQGDVWLVVTSEMFAEPGEATEIVDSALATLAG
jgi:hypothetical protein